MQTPQIVIEEEHRYCSICEKKIEGNDFHPVTRSEADDINHRVIKKQVFWCSVCYDKYVVHLNDDPDPVEKEA